MEKLLFMLPVFHGVFRSLCLEVLLTQADVRTTLYRELKEKGFHDMLKFRSEHADTSLSDHPCMRSEATCVRACAGQRDMLKFRSEHADPLSLIICACAVRPRASARVWARES